MAVFVSAGAVRSSCGTSPVGACAIATNDVFAIGHRLEMGRVNASATDAATRPNVIQEQTFWDLADERLVGDLVGHDRPAKLGNSELPVAAPIG